MIGLLRELVGWVRSLLRHHEQYEDRPGNWPHTFNDLDPSTKAPSATVPELDEAPEHRAHIDLFHTPTKSGPIEWTDDQGRKLKRFADGQVGEDISDLDITNINELRRIYGKAGIIPDEKLVQWANEAKGSVRDPHRQAEIRERLAQIPADIEFNDLTGYKPASGPNAGTSPKTGITLPPKVTEPTTKEWVDLKLEQAYGPNAAAMPAGAGYSMRYLNELRSKAERRVASAYELSILRSRGLV